MSHQLLKNNAIRLYNLYPRLVGPMNKWIEHFDRISAMGFNALWVNPFHYPGFSGSLYSPKDYYKFNPLFIDSDSAKAPVEQLREVIKACHDRDMLFIMDLVINHTAIDCTLIEEHPEWYVLDENAKVINPGAMHNGEWHAWGDLAQVNNLESPDKDNLWNFWWKMMSHYLDLGVDGFRCDMAYQIPSELWIYLISRAREKKPGCLFLAESLGCDFKQVQELAELKFDYLFSSIKYWDFNEPWAIEQYDKTAHLCPSIAFPESHDTPRLLSEMNGDLAAVKRQLLFSALFCSGYMIPMGFEYGFKKQLNVVKTDPTWWENNDLDLSGFIRSISDLKSAYPILEQEKGLEVVDQGNWFNVFCFKKSLPGMKSVFVIVNKDRFNGQPVFIPDMEAILGSDQYKDASFEDPFSSVPKCLDYILKPSEIKVFVVK